MRKGAGREGGRGGERGGRGKEVGEHRPRDDMSSWATRMKVSSCQLSRENLTRAREAGAVSIYCPPPPPALPPGRMASTRGQARALEGAAADP